MGDPRAIVVMPTYNEAESLPVIVGALLRDHPHLHILVVDDASPDGTGAIADALAAENARVQVLHRSRKEGLGPAYLAGFRFALAQGFGAVIEMDADGSHRSADLGALIAGLDQNGLVIGSRWIRGGGTRNWPLWRRALSRGGNAYARILLRSSVRDATSGFRAYRAATLRAILDEGAIASSGYCFQIDMTRRAQRTGDTITESPILFIERELGVSKMGLRIVAEAVARVPLWGWEERSWRRMAR